MSEMNEAARQMARAAAETRPKAPIQEAFATKPAIEQDIRIEDLGPKTREAFVNAGVITQEEADNIKSLSQQRVQEHANRVGARIVKNSEYGAQVLHPPEKSSHDKVLDFIAERNLNFLLGRAVEAICETDIKSDFYYLEDLRKAKIYIEREIQRITDNAAHH